MAKRIVKEILDNGDIQYRVETNRIFGFIPCGWRTCLCYNVEFDMHFDAVFDTLEEAMFEADISVANIVKREIIIFDDKS